MFDFNQLTNGRVFLIGNGGSHSNSQHIANDLITAGVAAFTLDPATLTATANDDGYEYIFSKWLRTVAKRGDLLIALSGSGTSKNILLACATAEMMGMKVWRVFGGEMGQNMQEAEEYQIKLGHEAMRWLKSQ